MSEEICTGQIDYKGDTYTVDDAGYFCTVCGTTGDEDSRIAYKSGESVPHRKGIGGYERTVIGAAAALTTSVRASRSVYGVADEFAHLYFEAEQGAYLAVLLEATDRLIAARARARE